jgi:hypothetical protein
MFKGQDPAPKTEKAIREVDIDDTLTEMIRLFIGERTSSRLFQSCKRTPSPGATSASACCTRLLERLALRKGGLHAFRHHA